MTSTTRKEHLATQTAALSGESLSSIAGTASLSIAEYQAQAEELLRRTGERVTRGRVMVLASLLEAKRALTHAEVETRIERLYDIDRVTVYRVLDWLTQLGLTHRLAGDDRIWRYMTPHHARPHGAGHQPHPHFKCNTCGDVICLDEIVAAPRVALPAGYRGEELEVTVKGQCAVCAPRKTAGSRNMRRTTRASRR
jgi:Fur family ferric uptake transcriptional regulator